MTVEMRHKGFQHSLFEHLYDKTSQLTPAASSLSAAACVFCQRSVPIQKSNGKDLRIVMHPPFRLIAHRSSAMACGLRGSRHFSKVARSGGPQAIRELPLANLAAYSGFA